MTNEENWRKLFERLDESDKKFSDLSDKITALDSKFNLALEKQEKRHQEDVNEIKKDIENLKNVFKKDLLEANNKTNELEQYTRNWCLRFIGVSIPTNLEKNVGHVRAALQTVWDRIILPILQQVVSDGVSGLDEVPDMMNVLENGHKLGRGKGTLPPPIIIRFTRRDFRDMVIRHRKYLPIPTTAEIAAGVEKFRVVEDLTHTNHQRLQELIKDPRIEKAWTIQGKFCLILKDDINKDIIHCRGNVFNVDELMKKIRTADSSS